MPVVISLFGYKIYFWTNEGKPLEPIHVHVSQKPNPKATKIWLLSTGKVKVANNNSRVPAKDLKRICNTIEIFHDKIEKSWINKFGKVSFYDKVNASAR